MAFLCNLDALAGLKCRFGCDDPIGVYHIPKGCVCWNDPLQALCWQHADRSQSEGPITMVVDLRMPAAIEPLPATIAGAAA